MKQSMFLCLALFLASDLRADVALPDTASHLTTVWFSEDDHICRASCPGVDDFANRESCANTKPKTDACFRREDILEVYALAFGDRDSAPKGELHAHLIENVRYWEKIFAQRLAEPPASDFLALRRSLEARGERFNLDYSYTYAQYSIGYDKRTSMEKCDKYLDRYSRSVTLPVFSRSGWIDYYYAGSVASAWAKSENCARDLLAYYSDPKSMEAVLESSVLHLPYCASNPEFKSLGEKSIADVCAELRVFEPEFQRYELLGGRKRHEREVEKARGWSDLPEKLAYYESARAAVRKATESFASGHPVLSFLGKDKEARFYPGGYYFDALARLARAPALTTRTVRSFAGLRGRRLNCQADISAAWKNYVEPARVSFGEVVEEDGTDLVAECHARVKAALGGKPILFRVAVASSSAQPFQSSAAYLVGKCRYHQPSLITQGGGQRTFDEGKVFFEREVIGRSSAELSRHCNEGRPDSLQSVWLDIAAPADRKTWSLSCNVKVPAGFGTQEEPATIPVATVVSSNPDPQALLQECEKRAEEALGNSKLLYEVVSRREDVKSAESSAALLSFRCETYEPVLTTKEGKRFLEYRGSKTHELLASSSEDAASRCRALRDKEASGSAVFR